MRIRALFMVFGVIGSTLIWLTSALAQQDARCQSASFTFEWKNPELGDRYRHVMLVGCSGFDVLTLRLRNASDSLDHFDLEKLTASMAYALDEKYVAKYSLGKCSSWWDVDEKLNKAMKMPEQSVLDLMKAFLMFSSESPEDRLKVPKVILYSRNFQFMYTSSKELAKKWQPFVSEQTSLLGHSPLRSRMAPLLSKLIEKFAAKAISDLSIREFGKQDFEALKDFAHMASLFSKEAKLCSIKFEDPIYVFSTVVASAASKAALNYIQGNISADGHDQAIVLRNAAMAINAVSDYLEDLDVKQRTSRIAVLTAIFNAAAAIPSTRGFSIIAWGLAGLGSVFISSLVSPNKERSRDLISDFNKKVNEFTAEYLKEQNLELKNEASKPIIARRELVKVTFAAALNF